MKYFLLFITFILFFGSANAQKIKKSEVPSYIISKFEAIYPTAESVIWFKKDSVFEVDFETYSVKSFYEKRLVDASARYSQKGNLLEYKEGMDPVNLPKEITDAFNQNYSGKKIKGAKISSVSGRVTGYTVVSKDLSVLFDPAGKVLQEIKE
jgi:hypothetical protein